jgi:hypothetical protein
MNTITIPKSALIEILKDKYIGSQGENYKLSGIYFDTINHFDNRQDFQGSDLSKVRIEFEEIK